MLRPFLPFLFCLGMGSVVVAAEIHVNPDTGDDRNDGVASPVKTIARGIRLAQPGDTVHLAPGTYHESADLTNKHGEPGKPITLDGHGAVLDGSEPVRSAEWESLGGGLYRKVKLVPRMDDAILGRWFFLWNGQMNRMDRTSKGPSAPLKAVTELKENEWTYLASEDAFYLRLPEGRDLDAVNLRYPKRSSAVIQSVSGSHHVVRNITGTHVYNDGFNVHGAQRSHRYENIAAIECGDDGFSAHEDADCRIDGFVSIGNSTGLCDTGTSRTHYRNVYIKDCHGYDLYFLGLEHSVENALIESRATRSLYLMGSQLPEGLRCRVSLSNVLIRRDDGDSQEIRISDRTRLETDQCTFQGLNVTMTSGGEALFRRTLVTGDSGPGLLIWEDSEWKGEQNRYEIGSLRVGQTSYTAATFADFQRATNSEAQSSWAERNEGRSESVGANEAVLARLYPAEATKK